MHIDLQNGVIRTVFKYFLDNCPLFKENNITLKEKQIETLRALYEDHDCVSVLPTGYGKSVIFQLLPWFCQLKMEKRKPMSVIVVSPLNSLIQDQVITMRKKGFTACSLNFTGMCQLYCMLYVLYVWIPSCLL
ncbi:hypothetical protein CI610_03607 [invertebrate metagenome]|uniref:DEAD/DEAH-box helicase domain-containing protein n=1 Tax=invertebrate metagenome TaxID=1711999 RepID=A0A2H9T2P7_9ZZZZ